MAGRRSGRRCYCAGNWKSRMTRWVALERFANGCCKLYCLDCRWRWKSRAKYCVDLKDHSPRSRKGLSDQDVLDRLIAGSLRIHPETATVESLFRGKTWRVLKPYTDMHGSGYLFVKINAAGRQKKIAVHRLQWMACHLSLVPAGHDVHHRRSPPRPRPKPNHIGNLELKESLDNQANNSPDHEWDDSAYVPF